MQAKMENVCSIWVETLTGMHVCREISVDNINMDLQIIRFTLDSMAYR
jgi:hypothetical protein